MRTPVIIALTATLVGCSSQPPRPLAAVSCLDKDEFVPRPAAAIPSVQLASVRTNRPAATAKSTVEARSKKPPSRHAHHATGKAKLAARKARPATRKTKPVTVAAAARPAATHIPARPEASSMPPEPKINVPADSGTTGQTIPGARLPSNYAPNPSGKTTREQVLAATAVAERLTMASLSTRDGAGSIAGVSRDNAVPPVAMVMVRPEITGVSDLFGQTVAIDDSHAASSIDIKIAIVAAGGPMVRLSTGRVSAMDRLLNGEVQAAILTLVSADAAEAFPDIAGFRILRVPLLKSPP